MKLYGAAVISFLKVFVIGVRSTILLIGNGVIKWWWSGGVAGVELPFPPCFLEIVHQNSPYEGLGYTQLTLLSSGAIRRMDYLTYKSCLSGRTPWGNLTTIPGSTQDHTP